jgi:hypothetical protein
MVDNNKADRADKAIGELRELYNELFVKLITDSLEEISKNTSDSNEETIKQLKRLQGTQKEVLEKVSTLEDNWDEYETRSLKKGKELNANVSTILQDKIDPLAMKFDKYHEEVVEAEKLGHKYQILLIIIVSISMLICLASLLLSQFALG